MIQIEKVENGFVVTIHKDLNLCGTKYVYPDIDDVSAMLAIYFAPAPPLNPKLPLEKVK